MKLEIEKRSNRKRSFPFVWALAFLEFSLWSSVTLAQTYSLKEINPIQSTMDAADPDSSSGGRVNGLGISSDGNTIYAASEWGGIWKTTDRGLTWQNLVSHRPQYTWDAEVKPSNNAVVFATSLYDGRITSSRSGLNISTNSGSNWSKPATFVPPVGLCDALRREELHGFGISIDPENNEHIFVGTSCGLAMSTDGGATWAFVDPTPGDPADNVWDVVVHDGGIIDLVGDDGHQRSTDGGTNWITATSNPLPSGRSSIAVSPDEPYVLVAVVGTSIFETDNGGDSWPNTFTNPSAQGRIPFVETNDRTGTAFDLWFGDTRLNRSTCTTPAVPAVGGARRCPSNTWSADFSRPAGGHNDCGTIIFDPSVAVDACPVAFSNDGGVYRNTLNTSPNCHSPTWEQANATTRALWLFGMGGSEIAGTTDENLYLGAQDNGSFATADPGNTTPTWTMRDCCDGFDDAAEPDRVAYTICCFSAAPNNRLFVRGNGMVAGAQINTVPAGTIPGFKFIDVIDVFGDDSYVLVTTSGVFVTSNIGANPVVWSQLGAATTPANVNGVKASVSGGTPSFFAHAGNCDGRSQDQLWRFDGTGAGNWTQINIPGGTGGFGIFDVDPAEPNRIIVSHIRPAADPEMMITTDGGTNWSNLPALDEKMTASGAYKYTNTQGASGFTSLTGYPQPSLVAFNPYLNNSIIAGALDAGLFISNDGGSTWSLLSYPGSSVVAKAPKGPTPFPFPYLKVYKAQVPRPWHAYFEKRVLEGTNWKQNVYIGTMGRGAWRLTMTTPSPFFDICKIRPWLCNPIEFEPPFVIITALGKPVIVTVDIPEICKRVIDCPGCHGGGFCPPYYNFAFDGIPYENVEVIIYDPKGNPVEASVVPSERGEGILVSFRPEKRHFNEKSIGDYKIAFVMNEKVKAGRMKVGVKLTVSDEPFDLKGKPFDIDGFDFEPEAL